MCLEQGGHCLSIVNPVEEQVVDYSFHRIVARVVLVAAEGEVQEVLEKTIDQ